MKKTAYILLTIFFISMTFQLTACKKNELLTNDTKRDVRAVWITTVFNKDWPSTKNDMPAQKKEFITILDDVSSLGFNTIIVQVRPTGDAFYKSSINPWSEYLTGVQGKDPGYDPLKFMIEEAHKRNLEIHAWLNPYRITIKENNENNLADNNFALKHPDLLIKHDNKLYYNPGLPEVRKHVVDTVKEIVQNYDIDGIHFDDYFYPGKDIDDKQAYTLYANGKNLDDFRRDCVNQLVAEVNNAIKTTNPDVKFGISPAGVWKNKSNDPTGSDTKGYETFYEIYCDTRAWIQNGWIDYVVPQLYWITNHNKSSYAKLVDWWNNEAKNEKPQLYIGQGIYKDDIAAEIDKQINLNRSFKNVKGSVYFTYSDIKENRQNIREKLKMLYKTPAIPYSMNWLDNTPPNQPQISFSTDKDNKIITIFNTATETKYYLIYRFKKNEKPNFTDPTKIIAKINNSGNETEQYIDNAQGEYYYAITALTRNHVESEPAIEL